jgi:SAM-dependent methyltransferase
MTDAPAEAMAAEFDVTAAWTEEAVGELGADYAVVAGCRGSGSPSTLAWLGEALEISADTAMLDAGSGVGGPATWLHDHFGVRPFCAEPMRLAARASRRLFGLRTVVARAQQLPYRDSSFDAAWALGVLCTTEDKLGLLGEVHRVLRTGGRLGLLVFIADGALSGPAPDGNHFPSHDELRKSLDAAGFTVIQSVAAQDLGDAPLTWQTRADRVDAVIEGRHGQSAPWRQAEEQSQRMSHLLAAGDVRATLVHAVAT